MTQLITGAALVVSGGVNLAILSEIVANHTFEDFKKLSPNSPITESQYESFIADIGTPLIDAGILTQNMGPTYAIHTKQKLL